MRPPLRILCRHNGRLRSVRTLATTFDQTTSKLPLRVGGTHYQEGDRVILINRDGKRVKSRLIAPLNPTSTTRTGLHAYEIKHSDIIGQPAGRLYVRAQSTTHKEKTGTFRVTYPSLDQFISLAPRTVTPIYSSYGATIVNLLDIHLPPPVVTENPRETSSTVFEVLEAGTGNGGLTLHLARAIAVANPPPPSFPNEYSESDLGDGWTEWRRTRRAVIHTVEYHQTRSYAAEKLIKSFRGAMYWPHIDFHDGDVGAWTQTELRKRMQQSGNYSDGFLDVVILDLPAVHSQIPQVVDALKVDGQLLVWVPQITQVAACQQKIEQSGLSLKLDQVVELGEGISNGRRWDLRFVKTRAELKKEQNAAQNERDSDGQISSDNDEELDTGLPSREETASVADAEFPTMVCRPMVGNLTMGGGFVGLWRKVPKRFSDTGEV